MPINYEQLMALKNLGQKFAYGDREVMLYAYGIGIGADPMDEKELAFVNEAALEHDIGIRFNAQERSDVEEYCVSEGWIKVPAGKARDRKGQPMMLKLKGLVEAFYR